MSEMGGGSRILGLQGLRVPHRAETLLLYYL
jgi:hypothetical protein